MLSSTSWVFVIKVCEGGGDGGESYKMSDMIRGGKGGNNYIHSFRREVLPTNILLEAHFSTTPLLIIIGQSLMAGP